MNEQQNSALIQSLYDAFGRGDITYILGKLTGDVSWIAEGPAIIPYTGKRRGETEVRGFFDALAGTLSHMRLTIDRFVAQGDSVATFGRFAATVKATNKSFDAAVGHYFRVQDGKVAVFVNLTDTAQIAAAYSGASAAAR